MNADRFVDSYNALAYCNPTQLPKIFRHPMMRDPEAEEWYRIRESEWETLKPLMDARVTFRVETDGGHAKAYERLVSTWEAYSEGSRSGYVWIRPRGEDWSYLLRALVLMVDRLGFPEDS